MNAPASQQVLYLVPTSSGVGLTTVSMGLVRSLDRMGVKAAFFKPIAQLFRGDTGPERSTYVIRNTTPLNPPDPLPYVEAEQLFTSGQSDLLMEQMVERFHTAAGDADVVVVEGLINMEHAEHTAELNQALARTLDASVILVGAPVDGDLALLDQDMTATAQEFGGIDSRRTLGAIVNFVNAPRDLNGNLRPDLSPPEERLDRHRIAAECRVFAGENFQLLGCIPWRHEIARSRMLDVAHHLGARVLNAGAMETRRVHRIFLCARNVEHITHVLTANALLIIPVDRMDLFVAACMAAQNGIPLAGIVFTSAEGVEPDHRIMDLCSRALETGLPLLAVSTDSYTTATQIPRMNTEIPVDDQERIEMSMDHVAGAIKREWVSTLSELRHEPHLSPAAFRYRLVQFARAARRRIVLPEGEEPRTIEAACICQRRGIAHCVLLGKPGTIRETAARLDVDLPEGIELLDPDPIRDRYVDALLELRRHKGLDRPLAILQLEDNITLGTMMLRQGEVDGLVSGAIHTTASTVRPALRIVRTRPGARSVSSIFFMLLPEQVVIYGDCAIHQDPDAETLAEIALQSADSAIAFGIEPKVAMISYSTGDSGQGADVEKVKEATRIAKERRPGLLIDGPLQYDAASTKSVAVSKAPDSPVAGEANVFIFPDLNTGNTTYKAVQRSANVISIGPMLQGLNQPVNDLSRGALVEDIVYTIAITAIQATQGSE